MKRPRQYRSTKYLPLDQQPLPRDPQAPRFFKYFFHPWDYILKPVVGNWKTYSRYPMKTRTMWRLYKSAKVFVGMRFWQQTRYGLLDIDSNSPYHPNNNATAYQNIVKSLRNLGIQRTKKITSSDSGGIHLYFFFPTKVNSFRLATGLKRVLLKANFEIHPGWLEIFPNTKRFGKDEFVLYSGHRLPLQQGSSLLDDDLNPTSNTLKDFLDAADWCAAGQDMRTLRRKLKSAYKWYKKTISASDFGYEGGLTWRSDLEDRIATGWTGSGQTNELLKDIANLGRVFHKLTTVPELADFIEKRAIASPGFFTHSQHCHEITQRARYCAESAIRYWSSYPSIPNRTITYAQFYDHAFWEEHTETYSTYTNSERSPHTRYEHNRCRRADTLYRLKQVIDRIRNQGNAIPTKIKDLIALLCQTSKDLFQIGFSERTLKKPFFKALWHPKYVSWSISAEPANTNALASCNAVVEPVETQKTVTTTPQPEPAHQEAQPKRSHPSLVVSKNDQKLSSPDSIQGKNSTKKDPTLMKCFVQAQPGTAKALSRMSCNKDCLPNLKAQSPQLSNSVDVVLESERSQFLTYKCDRSLSFEDTYQQNCDLIQTMIGHSYRFTWQQTTGLVSLKGKDQSTVKTITKGTLVKVLDDHHTSVFTKSERSLLVYIKPLHNSTDWLSGIAVPIHQLIPIKL